MILRSLHKRVTLACREKRKKSLDSDQTSSLINRKRKKFAEIKYKTLLAEKIENISHKQTNKQTNRQAGKPKKKKLSRLVHFFQALQMCGKILSLKSNVIKFSLWQTASEKLGLLL